MTQSKNRVLIAVSSCPIDKEHEAADPDAVLVKIIPEKGRASGVFRMRGHSIARDGPTGNPYCYFGAVAEAHTGIARGELSITVASNASGNLWSWWDHRRIESQVLKRSKFKGKQRAFNVYLDGEEIDTAFYAANVSVDAEEVRGALVNHDGYNASIKVYEEGHGCPKCEGEEAEDAEGSIPCPSCGFGGAV